MGYLLKLCSITWCGRRFSKILVFMFHRFMRKCMHIYIYVISMENVVFSQGYIYFCLVRQTHYQVLWSIYLHHTHRNVNLPCTHQHVSSSKRNRCFCEWAFLASFLHSHKSPKPLGGEQGSRIAAITVSRQSRTSLVVILAKTVENQGSPLLVKHRVLQWPITDFHSHQLHRHQDNLLSFHWTYGRRY